MAGDARYNDLAVEWNRRLRDLWLADIRIALARIDPFLAQGRLTPTALPPSTLIDRGTYSGGATYRKGDVVHDGGNTYVAKAPSTGQPTSDPAYWTPLGGAGGGSLSFKDAVRAATTAAGTLATSFENGDVIDGVTLATGDRILIKDQATASQNGIYVVAASGAPARATDADTSAEVKSGLLVAVDEGTVNADALFLLTTNDPITLGTTGLTFARYGLLTVEEADGSPTDGAVIKIVVPNGMLAITAHVATLTLRALSPLTTKGDLIVGGASGVESRLGVGTDTYALIADAAQALGVKWAAVRGANPMTVAGDIIVGGAAGVETRKAIGAAGQYAEVNAGATDLAYVYPLQTVSVPIGNGVDTIVAGNKVRFECPYAGYIEQWTLVNDAGTSASLVIDLWRDTYANYPPTVADTITASAKPTLASAAKNQDATLTGWTRTFAQGDWIIANVDSASGLAAATLSLRVRRTA